jgi:lysophospholipase L1-like esterase
MTTLPVPSKDPRDLLFNAEKIDEAVNSSALTYTDRFGIQRKTLAGAIQSIIAVNPRGPWVTATAYALKDIVTSGGTSYICVQAHTSGATFAGDVAYWRVYQGVTTTDLAQPSAAASIGTAASGNLSGASVQAQLNELDAEKVAVTALAASAGSLGVGHSPEGEPADTVQAELRASIANLAVAVPSAAAATRRDLAILGDSISAGAYSLNAFMHAWVRVFERCFNAEVGATSYGFTSLLTLGTAGTTTTDIHSVNFSGTAWTNVDAASSAQAQLYPNGQAMRAGGATSAITITVPTFQNRVAVYYGVQSGGGGFTIAINGVVKSTIATAGTAGFAVATVDMEDNTYGDCVITIQSTSAVANPVDICGVAYLSAASEPVLHNFAESGRRLRYVSESVISTVMASSATVVMALGHNDQGTADTDNTYYADFMQRITWLTTYANANSVRLIVPDFCWTAASTSRTRAALKKLAADTGGVYINLPGALFKPGVTPTATYLTDTLKMWTDASHPNKAGHQWIAETIARRMGFSCASKAQAINFNDWWMPIALKAATAVYNYFPLVSAKLSSYRRNGTQIAVKVFVRASPSASFPMGSYVISDAWRAKSEIAAIQGYSNVAVVRSDTGAIASNVYAGASGQLTLHSLTNSWLNYQDFTFSMAM